MDNDIAWPALLVGLTAVLGCVAALVWLRADTRGRSSSEGSGLAPVAFLVLPLLMLAGMLLSLWALDLRGNLGR